MHLLFLEPGQVTEAPLPNAPAPGPWTNDREKTPNISRRSPTKGDIEGRPGLFRKLTGKSAGKDAGKDAGKSADKGEGRPGLMRRLSGEDDSRGRASQHSLRRIPSSTDEGAVKRSLALSLRRRKRSQATKRGPGDEVEDPVTVRSPEEREESEQLEPSHNNAPGVVAPLPQEFGSVYLFHWASMVRRSSYRNPMHTKWYNDIYRHPEQQGPAAAEVRRNMGHDIYSLSVCLLEIGLWETLVHEIWVHDEKSAAFNKESRVARATMSSRLAGKLSLGSSDEALKNREGPEPCQGEAHRVRFGGAAAEDGHAVRRGGQIMPNVPGHPGRRGQSNLVYIICGRQGPGQGLQGISESCSRVFIIC